MEYIDFILENYIWFLVAFIVIVMTIIGYFAEQTEFGKKVLGRDIEPKTEKKKKKKKKDIFEEIMEEQNQQIPVVESPTKEETKKEDLTTSLEQKSNISTEEVKEDLKVPFGDIKTPIEKTEKEVTAEPIKEPVEKKEPIVEPLKTERIIKETPTFEMPKPIEKTEKKVEEEPKKLEKAIPKRPEEIEEDDVWNF